MVWRPEDAQGNEAAKVRGDALPYCLAGIDIGCGPSKVFPHLTGVDNLRDVRLFGIDMKPDLVVNDAADLPFKDRAVPTVFSSHTLEHIADYKAALAEWWRVLAVGGHLVLYLPHRDFYPNIGRPGANPDHKHDFAPADIEAAMREIAADWTLLENQARNEGREYSFLQVYRKELAGAGQRVSPPLPEKRAGVVRVGSHGDALWASSVCAHLKKQGYHVTVYASSRGAEVLRHDPNIDRCFPLPDKALSDAEFLAWRTHEAVKYAKWVDLVGSVENRLLYHPGSNEFYLSHRLRHLYANRNYLEVVHEYADLPQGDYRQRFYPSAEEAAVARQRRAEIDGPLVVIAPAGSGPVKYWPHAQRLMELLAAEKIHSVVLGDVPDGQLADVEPYGKVVGMRWSVREALAYTLLADAVVGTESLIVNAVAFEPMLKVVTLSHSSNENLTRHWRNTAALAATGLPCYPCHRVHPRSYKFCAQDQNTLAAACLAAVAGEMVARLVAKHIRSKQAKAA
jgi:ADP-heptose:LPS heptosyltransferase/predicted SAM-dependent methyltransferase